MAKKTKRSVTAAARPVEKSVAAAGSSPIYVRRGNAAEFNPDYGYIINDLKRIGLLAGAFFGILIVVSFFL